MSDAPLIRVRDVMNTSFGTVDVNATISDALEIMRERSSAVLVVDRRHEDDEYGLLLCSDIAREVLSKDRAPARVNVYEIMRKPVVCVRPEMDIRLCSRLFVDYGLTRAPVIEGSTLIGTVSPNRLVLLGLFETARADKGAQRYEPD